MTQNRLIGLDLHKTDERVFFLALIGFISRCKVIFYVGFSRLFKWIRSAFRIKCLTRWRYDTCWTMDIFRIRLFFAHSHRCDGLRKPKKGARSDARRIIEAVAVSLLSTRASEKASESEGRLGESVRCFLSVLTSRVLCSLKRILLACPLTIKPHRISSARSH